MHNLSGLDAKLGAAYSIGFNAMQFLDTKELHTCLYSDFTEIILTKSNGQEESLIESYMDLKI